MSLHPAFTKRNYCTCCGRVLDVSLLVRKAALQAAQDACQAAQQAAATISVQPFATDALTAYIRLAESLCSLLAMTSDSVSSSSAEQQKVSLCPHVFQGTKSQLTFLAEITVCTGTCDQTYCLI